MDKDFIIRLGITLIIFAGVFMIGFYKGYKFRDKEIEELKDKNKKIIEEFENYKRNRNIQVEKIKEELKTIREKQGKIKGIIKYLRKARHDRNINDLKKYVDMLLRIFKER